MFTPLFHRYPHHRVLLQAIGLVGASLALLGSAFATEPFHLLITMGCIYPLSGCKRALYDPIFLYTYVLTFISALREFIGDQAGKSENL